MLSPDISYPGSHSTSQYQPFSIQKGRVISLDHDLIDLVAPLNAVDDILILGTNHRAKNRMFPVEPWSGDVRNEKLAAIGACTSVGHG